MAPSRGLTLFRNSGFRFNLHQSRWQSTFVKATADTTRKTQIYVSRTLDPYLNLSIEQFLLQKSPPDSTILFLYTNRPCVVIGRNQNPWIEANLGLLEPESANPSKRDIGPISLVRRRSGGGTVFHDEGNVNYSVLCPTAAFNRDKHAQMVVRALKRLGVKGAKVNERHDIVLERESEKRHAPKEKSMQISAEPVQNQHKQLKVSGSAYRLTRLRSLHHGTCLLSSPNIHQISQYLRSPAKPFIKARGVDSVRSPITNLNVSNEAFENGVISEFGQMYGSVEPLVLADETSEIPEIAKGFAEMKSLEWTYMKTPQFTFSSHATNDDPRVRPLLPDYFPPNVTLSFIARDGIVTEAELGISGETQSLVQDKAVVDTSAMLRKEIHTIDDWGVVIPESLADHKRGLSQWLNELFGKRVPRESP